MNTYVFKHNTVTCHICYQVLPNEYGGTGGSLAEITDFWVNEAANQKDWFARFFLKKIKFFHINFMRPKLFQLWDECMENIQ